jgi:hypothetical protein
MTTHSPAEIVAHWFKLVGVGSNEPLYLNVEPNRCYISDAAGEVATLSTDWDQLMDAPTMAELAEIVQRDIDEYEAVGEDE